jgi:hypothetical protein
VHALTRALPWAGVWPCRRPVRASVGRSDMSHVCVCGPTATLVPTFRREDSAHRNSHLRALDSSQELGERHDRFKTPGDEPDKNRLFTVAQARTHARSHARTTSPRPRCQPSGRLGLEDTGRRRDTISSAPRSLPLAPNSRLCWIAHSHAALLALTSPPERAPLRASRAGESAHQLSKRCDALLCNLFLSSPTVDPAAVAAACHIVTCAGG